MTDAPPAPEARQRVAVRSLDDYDRLVKSQAAKASEPRTVGREIGELILRDLRRFSTTPERHDGR